MDRFEALLLENHPEGPDACKLTFQLPLLDPIPLAGQFFMVRLRVPGFPLFGRALAVCEYEADGGQARISFLAKRAGTGTGMMLEALPNTRALLLGPAGRGFPRPEPDRPFLMVAGGTGVAAFYYLLHSGLAPAGQPILIYGARDKASLYLLENLKKLSLDLEITTEDGSVGMKGLVTQALEQVLDRLFPAPQIFACGPDPMMKAVTQVCAGKNLDPYLSLETRMACGIGVCNGCAVEVVRDGEKRFERACHEGPVFPAQSLPAFFDQAFFDQAFFDQAGQ